jgi:hypothetical protein
MRWQDAFHGAILGYGAAGYPVSFFLEQRRDLSICEWAGLLGNNLA